MGPFTDNWKEDLLQFLISYFGEEELEVGISELVFVTSDHEDYHKGYLNLINRSIEASKNGDTDIPKILFKAHASGARRVEEATKFLETLRDEYLKKYNEETKRP